MSTGVYGFAGRRVRIQSLHSAVHTLCRDYAAQGEPDFCVTITPEDIQKERQKGALQDAREGRPPRHRPEDYLETLAVYRKIAEEMPRFDTLLIHGSAIALDGEGYLFTAKSGTGKSTHTRLWREAFGDRTFMVNDDKPLLRITDRDVCVCGTPWDGKHHLSTNAMVPLKAICLLERGEVNRIREISPSEALPGLLQQCYRPEGGSGVLKTLDLLDMAARRVKFFRLECNMDPEAALISGEAMGGC